MIGNFQIPMMIFLFQMLDYHLIEMGMGTARMVWVGGLDGWCQIRRGFWFHPFMWFSLNIMALMVLLGNYD